MIGTYPDLVPCIYVQVLGHVAAVLCLTPMLSSTPVAGQALNMAPTHYNPRPRPGLLQTKVQSQSGAWPQGLAQVQIQELTFLILREVILEALYLCL